MYFIDIHINSPYIYVGVGNALYHTRALAQIYYYIALEVKT